MQLNRPKHLSPLRLFGLHHPTHLLSESMIRWMIRIISDCSLDNNGKRETWYDISPETRFRSTSSKMFSKAVEYHLTIPCMDPEKKKCGLP